jgi:hypothetical protein
MKHILIALSVAGIIAATTGLLRAFHSNPFFVGQSNVLPRTRLVILWYIKTVRKLIDLVLYPFQNTHWASIWYDFSFTIMANEDYQIGLCLLGLRMRRR